MIAMTTQACHSICALDRRHLRYTRSRGRSRSFRILRAAMPLLEQTRQRHRLPLSFLSSPRSPVTHSAKVARPHAYRQPTLCAKRAEMLDNVSSPEYAGEFRFEKLARGMKQRGFQHPRGSQAAGLSHGGSLRCCSAPRRGLTLRLWPGTRCGSAPNDEGSSALPTSLP